MLETVRGILKCQDGATAVEYGLIAGLIVVVLVAALSNVAFSTSDMWNAVSNKVITASENVS
ncbi:Flp family type IVb pilin [Sphingorhabdus arenilitoris]|uniref:Flp family type IVb pilin n=1 Tax=Sphingorhabdus arenilitoris TaxID=1490041 RepID=A0ABV8RF70_9SPHN